jgi:hypothetical protein
VPSTLPTLTATRWIEFKGSGRTRPAVMACELPDGTEVECIVKLGGHKESAPHQPVCELGAALLAVDLGLPVADPMLVEVTADFAERVVPAANLEAKERCQKAVGLSFATRNLTGGYAVFPVGKPPPKSMVPALAELYAFDGLIQNADRTPTNPNCLVKGDDLRFFDHDQAFGFLLDLFGAQAANALDSYPFLSRHVAYRRVPRDRSLFLRLERAWKAINEETIAGYGSQIPDAWPGKKTYFPPIEAHLRGLHAVLASALDVITLTLPPP